MKSNIDAIYRDYLTTKLQAEFKFAPEEISKVREYFEATVWPTRLNALPDLVVLIDRN